MQSALIIGLMFLSALAKVGAVLRIAISRLTLRYPLFLLMASCGAVRSIVLLSVGGWAGRLHPYLEIWRATQGISFALEAAACLEAFWILALHFRNIRLFGSIVLVFVASIGAALSYSVVAVWSRWWTSPFTQGAILMEHVALMLIAIALFSLLFFRQFSSVPVKPNAIRHLSILTLLFLSLFISGFFAQSDRHIRVFLANLAFSLGNFAAYGAWALLIRPSGERLPFSPAPPLLDGEFEAAEAQDRWAVKRRLQEARASFEDLKRGTRS
jgi:hypothetical protein